MEKIKVAFIKFGGMANGGTEKYLQTIAAHLPKDEFDVDFFYCDAAPYIGRILNILIQMNQELSIQNLMV